MPATVTLPRRRRAPVAPDGKDGIAAATAARLPKPPEACPVVRHATPRAARVCQATADLPGKVRHDVHSEAISYHAINPLEMALSLHASP